MNYRYLALFLSITVAAQGALLSSSELVVATSSGTAQAPTLSSDGKSMIYEVAGKSGTSLWIAGADGKGARSLTEELQRSEKLPAIVENAAWHPREAFLTFEGSRTAEDRNPRIFTARILDGKIAEFAEIGWGKRPRFSHPYGRTLFCELGNSLRYVVIGPNPLKPKSTEYVDLRGPIQRTSGLAFTHPQVTRDGNTVFFAAGSALYEISTSPEFSKVLAQIKLDSTARQRIIAIWPKLKEATDAKLIQALKAISGVFGEVDAPFIAASLTEDLAKDMKRDLAKKKLESPAKGLPGINQRDLLRAWILGFLRDRNRTQAEVEEALGTKIWVTDLFGGALKPVAPSAPVPQKFPTATADARFVVFESGLYNNRHLYVANAATGKATPLTTKGTYNSSPALTADDKYVYYESNEAGRKEIRRATIDWKAVEAALK